jgi:tetratricopeptide (TPR) repeat protein
MLFYVVPSAAVPFTGRDWIVVADFENSTGEEVFEKSLNTAFGISVEQSSYVNVMPRSRMADVLRRMKRTDSQRVDEPTAREIALREEVNLIVVPGISKVGTSYALTWKIEEAKDGETLKSGVIPAGKSEDILPSLDEMSQTIRRMLGESRLSIAWRGRQLARVTTKSLEALKQYSLGIENHLQINFAQARYHYASALKLDSTFTAARASLGMVCYEKFDTTEGKRYLSEAVRNLDGLTDKERFGILAFHARAVENNFDLAIKNWQSLLELYPDYGVAHSNLGFLYFQSGRHGEAASEYKEAIRCDPTLYLAYYGLEWLYLYQMGEVDSAIVWSKRHLARAPDQVFAYDNLAYAYVGKDSLELALTGFQKVVELNPKYTVGLYRLSDTYRMLGRYVDAVAPLEKVIDIEASDANAKYQLGVLYLLMGKKEKAETYLQIFRAESERLVKEEPGMGPNYISLGKALILLGDKNKGWEIGAKGMTLDTSAHFESAQLLSLLGRNSEAIDQLELAVRAGFRNYIWLKLHPDLWSLRNEPRFQQFLHGVLKG